MSKPKKASTPVEIVPDFNSPEFTQLGTDIAEAMTAIGYRTQKFQEEVCYLIVRGGLHLMQAKKQLGHGNFLPWLTQNRHVADLKISERTAQRYMAAAENAGLTEGSTLKDIEALHEAKALHGTKPTDLYKLKDAAPTDAPGGQMQFNLVTEVLSAVMKDCDQAVILRDRMDAREYEACWTKLKLTLEALTDSPWDMIDRETGTPASQRRDARGRKKGGRR